VRRTITTAVRNFKADRPRTVPSVPRPGVAHQVAEIFRMSGVGSHPPAFRGAKTHQNFVCCRSPADSTAAGPRTPPRSREPAEALSQLCRPGSDPDGMRRRMCERRGFVTSACGPLRVHDGPS
jgi:hypothetical protein